MRSTAGATVLAVCIVVSTLAACGDEIVPAPTPRIVALRTVPFNGVCAGVGVEAIVRGAPDDPAVAWLAPMFAAGKRQDVVWPRGDVAVFDPTLRIVDAAGQTVLRDGDYIDGACVTGPDAAGPLLIPNPEDAFRLECGPMDSFECSAMLGAVRYGSSDWPKDRVAVFSFIDARGSYVITLEDGRRIEGLAPQT